LRETVFCGSKLPFLSAHILTYGIQIGGELSCLGIDGTEAVGEVCQLIVGLSELRLQRTHGTGFAVLCLSQLCFDLSIVLL
jgi:hypothetical protein